MYTAVLCWGLMLVAMVGQQPAPPSAASNAAASLDYEFFKAKVQPIFLNKRPGHARCISCHGAGTPLRLQPLSPGSTTFTEEQSRQNFEAIQRVVVRGNLKSMLLVHPLAEEAGGDFFHSGGKHFNSQNDPEWQILKAFALGQTK
jgi:hypothetical protein